MPPDPAAQVRLYACAATTGAQRITDAQLFVLMASEHCEKGGRQLRWFSDRDLDKASVTRHLVEWGTTLKKAIQQLRRHRLLLPAGERGRLRASTEGNTVKHTFNNLQDFAIGRYTAEPLSGSAVQRIRQLRAVMIRICDETLRERASVAKRAR